MLHSPASRFSSSSIIPAFYPLRISISESATKLSSWPSDRAHAEVKVKFLWQAVRLLIVLYKGNKLTGKYKNKKMLEEKRRHVQFAFRECWLTIYHKFGDKIVPYNYYSTSIDELLIRVVIAS
jgi:hypothetical protein